MTELLHLQDVTKRFGGLVAVDGVSCTINVGEIVGLIGPNGAGKTSLFNLIAGTFAPDAGQILLAGERIETLRPDQRVDRGVARTFQVMRPYRMLTLRDNVVVAALKHHRRMRGARAWADECLGFVGLSRFADVPAGGLSTGQLKRLELARALACKPRLLLLDEVTGGVDLGATEQLVELINGINEMGITLVVVEHRMEVLSLLSKRLICMLDGRIVVDGSPETVLSNREVAAAYLGQSYA